MKKHTFRLTGIKPYKSSLTANSSHTSAWTIKIRIACYRGPVSLCAHKVANIHSSQFG